MEQQSIKPRKEPVVHKELIMVNMEINHEEEKEQLRKFILFYKKDDSIKYLDNILSGGEDIIINMSDVLEYFSAFDTTTYTNFMNNTYTYLKMMYGIVDEIKYEQSDVLPVDPFISHRISRFKEKFPESSVAETLGFLLRNYTIKLRIDGETINIRELRSELLGKLVKVGGIVTKITQVKPAVKVATYICEACGTETYQQINNNDTFDLLEQCSSESCKRRHIRGALCLISRGSKFVKYQQLSIQESNESVPQGSVPRYINVDLYGSDTEVVRPGERVVLNGIYMPKPYYGYKALKAGLINDTYLLCTHMERRVDSNTMDLDKIDGDTLIKSLAPEIYGMGDIKKLLMLSLISSPGLETHEGMKIRGELNILLVGDPGIAKSQLLKSVTRLSRRGVYTTGQSSSAAGLTASVSKDPITNEYVLEGGALVLADRGICCIDEFDKMNELDRVSIHEVMEQQSISVCKAGINTTLNARCSVIAAANPVKGRYDPKKSLEFNINLPVSLMSRFDVIAILQDNSDESRDLAMANHITKMHVDGDYLSQIETLQYDKLSMHIENIKNNSVSISEDLKSMIVDTYIQKRNSSIVTPRWILSIIRLSMANARLYGRSEVSRDDVSEGMRLLDLYNVKKVSSREDKHTETYNIYNLLTGAAVDGVVKLNDFYRTSGYSVDKVDKVILKFSDLGIWSVVDDELVFYE